MTDQTMRAVGAPQFSIGNVLGKSFAVFTGNLLKFCAVPAILLVPFAIVGFLVGLRGIMNTVALMQAGQMPGGGFYLTLTALFLLTIIWSCLASAILVSGAFQALRTRTIHLGSAFKRGFASLIPIVMTAIVLGLLITVVAIVCLIPGGIIAAVIGAATSPTAMIPLLLVCMVPVFFLWAAFWLFTPAIVVEGKGIGSSLGRSRELTKGHRWAVFAVVLILLVLNWAIGLVNQYVIAPSLSAVVSGIFSIVVLIVWQAYNAIAITVTYYLLRADKEGISIDEIAKVFD